MVLGDFNCIISDLDTKSGNMVTSNNLKLILENIIDTLWWIHLDGVFNLCQHLKYHIQGMPTNIILQVFI